MATANCSVPDATVIHVLAYTDVAEAADWLCRAFGFRRRLVIGDRRVQLTFGDGAVIATEGGGAAGPLTHSVLVRVEDADAHQKRAAATRAVILSPPTD